MLKPTEKSSLMIGLFLSLWTIILFIYGPRLWCVIVAGNGPLEIALLASFSFLLVIFWSLAAYYISIIIFSYLSKPLSLPPDNKQIVDAKIAILYPTCNDFQYEAAESCLNQDYRDFHLFLLDDSTAEVYRKAVDSFHLTHSGKTTVIRRGTRIGFKAGNLNNGLRGAAADYPFFAVVDADERLPVNFLTRAITYLHNSDYAFVQANHSPNPKQQSRFAQDIGPTILPFWHVHCKPRNQYGFVPFIGHGAVIRRSAWETVGGFPEIITEDLGFSVELGQRGMRGLFIHDLLCYEDFPEDYQTFKRQQERYVIGTTQVILKYFCKIVMNNKLHWFEKVDFFLWCSPLYVPALVLLFVILGSVGLPLAFGTWHQPVISVIGNEIALPKMRLLDEPFKLISSWDFQLFSLLCALSPAFASISLGFQKKLKAIRLLFLSTVPYLSLMVIAWRGILGYLFRGRVLFPPTGQSLIKTYLKDPKAISEQKIEYNGQNDVWTSPWKWEICIGIFLAVASLVSMDLGLFAVSSCLMVGVGIQFVGWEKKSIRIIAVCCFVMIIFQMGLSFIIQTASRGMTPLIFSVHF